MSLSRRRAGRGALIILAAFLASSGALRIGSGLGAAVALMPDAPTDPVLPQQCAEPPGAVAAALAEKAAQINAREIALTERMAALELAEKVAQERITRMEAAETSLKATVAQTDGAAEQDVARLTEIYQAMKPAEAAAIFQAMSPEFAAGFLARMEPQAAGAILGGMPPETAYGVSALIAGRNARAPRN